MTTVRCNESALGEHLIPSFRIQQLFFQFFQTHLFVIILWGLNPSSTHVKMISHETIFNDDFWCNTGFKCWNNVAAFRNDVATMLSRSVALKIVVANRPV